MRGRTWLLTLPAAACLVACSTSGLALVEDDRVDVLAPADRSDVTLPLTVRWSAHDLPAGTAFGVVVDEALPRPGQEADEEVIRTTDTSVVLDQLGAASSSDRGHDITVILLDPEGRRLGEGAWQVGVDVEEGP